MSAAYEFIISRYSMNDRSNSSDHILDHFICRTILFGKTKNILNDFSWILMIEFH